MVAAPVPPPARLPTASAKRSRTCEQAQQEYLESYAPASDSDRTLDTPASDYGARLGRGEYLARCNVPSGWAVTICAAVQNGRAQGVTVHTVPPSPETQECLTKAVFGIEFPSQPTMDIARIQFQGLEPMQVPPAPSDTPRVPSVPLSP
jgi:hypothetical protein